MNESYTSLALIAGCMLDLLRSREPKREVAEWLPPLRTADPEPGSQPAQMVTCRRDTPAERAFAPSTELQCCRQVT